MVSVLDGYTVTEHLVLDVLAARTRLGEALWTFPRELRPTMKRLEARGLLSYKSGVVEGTLMVWLSEAGKEASMSPDYVAPISVADELAVR